VTPEQAKALSPLWQAVVALSDPGTTAAEEPTAAPHQIAAAMTPEPLPAVAARLNGSARAAEGARPLRSVL